MSEMLANGVRLNYETFGRPSDPALVMIRGLGTQMVDWHPDLIEALVKLNLYVVIFDNRDVGLSEKLADRGTPSHKAVLNGEVMVPYTLSDMAADVCGLMDGLAIEKAHILGISLGGMIAGLPGPTEQAQQAFVEPIAEDIEGVIEQTTRHKLVFGSPGYPESLEERIRDARNSVERCHYPDGVHRQRLAAASQLDRSMLLPNIYVPTSVIHGEDDALIPVACGEDTARLIPDATFVPVPGMGHNIPKLLVPEFVKLVAAHIERAAS